MPKILDDMPPDYLQAIGEVAVRWNHLELILNLFLIRLIGLEIMDDKSHIPFAHMAFPQKLQAMSSLVDKVSKEPHFSSLKDYKAVEPLLREAQEKRNFVIHAIWGAHEGGVQRTSISARKSFKFSSNIASLEDVRKVSVLIEEARAKLSALASLEWRESIRSHKEGKT